MMYERFATEPEPPIADWSPDLLAKAADCMNWYEARGSTLGDIYLFTFDFLQKELAKAKKT